MLAYLDDRPTAYLDELALAVYDRFDIDLAPYTVFDYLCRNNWSRKVVKERATQRNASLRAL